MPSFTGLYWALSCSTREGGAPCGHAAAWRKNTAAARTSNPFRILPPAWCASRTGPAATRRLLDVGDLATDESDLCVRVNINLLRSEIYDLLRLSPGANHLVDGLSFFNAGRRLLLLLLLSLLLAAALTSTLTAALSLSTAVTLIPALGLLLIAATVLIVGVVVDGEHL